MPTPTHQEVLDAILGNYFAAVAAGDDSNAANMAVVSLYRLAQDTEQRRVRVWERAERAEQRAADLAERIRLTEEGAKRPAWIAVWDVDRAFGGAEEGGWYYDCGTLSHCEAIPTDASPEWIAARMADLREEWTDPDALPVYSVRYAGGVVMVTTESVYPSPYFPERSPRYS